LDSREQMVENSELPPNLPADVAERQMSRIDVMLDELRNEIRGLAIAQRELNNDSIIKQLHAELQESRAGLHWRILKTVLIDLVRLHDDLTAASAKALESVDDHKRVLLEFRQEVLDLLDRHGFVPFTHEGDHFDPKRQDAVRRIVTSDSASIGLVAERLAVGFKDESKVLRPEKVAIYTAPPLSNPKNC
jgi:molecular chaperone GrpE (heat shock protein)